MNEILNEIFEVNFVKAMTLPTKNQVKRIIKELDIMAEDLNEEHIIFEYYSNKDNEWILNVDEDSKEKFEKRIGFILDLIKKSGGF